MDSIDMIAIIKTKIHRNWYLWFIIMIVLFSLIILWLQRTIDMIIQENFNAFWLILPIALGCFMLLVVKDFKIIRIYKENKKLKYYNILCPFGKTISFDNYISKIKSTETGSGGSYEVIYLVDKEGYTAFKITGLFYKNMKEIDDAIALPLVKNYDMNVGKYFKLLFTGRIKIEKAKKPGANKKTETSIKKVLTVFIAIALGIFVLGTIIRIITKLI